MKSGSDLATWAGRAGMKQTGACFTSVLQIQR